TAPGSGDIATFDSGGNTNCTIDANVTIGGLNLTATYSRTLTINASILVIDNGNWTLSGGSISAAASSTVKFVPSTMTITGSQTLGNVTIDANTGGLPVLTIASGTTLTVNGTLTLNNSAGNLGGVNQKTEVDTGTIEAKGDITIDATDFGNAGISTATLLIDGTGSQTFTGTATQTHGGLFKVTITKSSGTLIFSGTIRTDTDWTYTSGTISPGSSTVVFSVST